MFFNAPAARNKGSRETCIYEVMMQSLYYFKSRFWMKAFPAMVPKLKQCAICPEPRVFSTINLTQKFYVRRTTVVFCRFLEEYIARLTAKLSELQHLDDKVAGDVESGQHSGRQDCARLTQRAQLDLEQVQPLLVAYDATIARLQAKLVDRQDEVQKFEQRLEQISGNNAGLLETLKMAVQEAATTVRITTCGSIMKCVSG